jgi:hypothetical protein
MAVTVAGPPEQGQLVSVRSRRWVVNDVRPSTIPASSLKPTTFSSSQHMLMLASVKDDGLCEAPTGFDPPVKLDAFLDTVRWGEASIAHVKSLQAPYLSSIDTEDYQLNPVVRTIQMPRVNLLSTDELGLEKAGYGGRP